MNKKVILVLMLTLVVWLPYPRLMFVTVVTLLVNLALVLVKSVVNP